MYVIFEGMDGSGKTTTMRAAAQEMQKHGIDPILTSHPGSTPLGAHLRQLVKNPKSINIDINIDPLSRQLLYLTDMVSFVRSILEPALDNNQWVFADRSTIISAIIYGGAEGLDTRELEVLHSIITPPRADKLYILTCPPEVAIARINSTRSEQDHYDNKPDDFFRRIWKTYDNLLFDNRIIVQKVVSLDRVKYLSTENWLEDVVDSIVEDLLD